MRFLKLAIISLFFLFLGIWLFSLLFPSSVRVSRAININRPMSRVMDHLKDLRQWESWNLMLREPDLHHPLYSEKGFNSDELKVDLFRSTSDSVITYWKRKEGEAVTSGLVIHSADSSLTIVQWYFDFSLKWYPWEKFGSIVLDKQFGPLMEKSLEKLKQVVEE